MATTVETCQHLDSENDENEGVVQENMKSQKPDEVSQCISEGESETKQKSKEDKSVLSDVSSPVDIAYSSSVDGVKDESEQGTDFAELTKENDICGESDCESEAKETCENKEKETSSKEAKLRETYSEDETKENENLSKEKSELEIGEKENCSKGEEEVSELMVQENKHKEEHGSGAEDKPNCSCDKEENQGTMASEKVSSPIFVTCAPSNGGEEDSVEPESPVPCLDQNPTHSDGKAVSGSEVKETSPVQADGDCRRQEVLAVTKAVNTEPITEVLREILQVSPDRTASKDPSNTGTRRTQSECLSSPNGSSMSEQSSANTHSIALDDPAIVTSSDECTSGSSSNSRTTVPYEGDGSALIMNLLRKGLQNDPVNKGDGDRVYAESKGEKSAETVMDVENGTESESTSDEKGSDTRSKAATEVPRGEERPVREMLVRRQASQTSMPASDKPVLETLTFGTSLDEGDGTSDGEEASPKKSADRSCPCPLCDRSFPADNKEDVLAHLVLVHKFVIADVNFIGNLSVYLRYWKERLKTRPVSEFCSKIVTNTGVKDEAEKEEFYLLCDALPEDKDIREQLQRKKLEQVLAQQQREREETKFCRQCLFCKQTFCGNRAVLFDHLLRDHMFHMGQPDNLVFTDELFDLIQFKLDSQLCLFCEKSFKDKPSLREHMRKKQHRKINPKNKEYDRFYIINYMEMGKNWESLQQEDTRLIKTNEGSDEEDEWADWSEECQNKVVCLFCDSASADQQGLHKHMKEDHSFDLQDVNQKLQLNFYQKVKLINYIRRQVYHKTCYGCQESFLDKPQLTEHMTKDTDHINKLPESSIWDQSQYFFPTYEDDNLLCYLDDDDEGASGDALGVTVYAEDIPVSDSTLLRDQRLHRELLKA